MPKPVNLGDIPGADSDYIERLASAGIKNTKQLFEKGSTKIMATLKDVMLCIKIAKELPKVVEY